MKQISSLIWGAISPSLRTSALLSCALTFAFSAVAQTRNLRESAEISSVEPIVAANAYVFSRTNDGRGEQQSINQRNVVVESAGGTNYRLKAELTEADRVKSTLIVFYGRTASGNILTSSVTGVSGLKFAEFSPALRCNTEMLLSRREELEKLSSEALDSWMKAKTADMQRVEREVEMMLTPERLKKIEAIGQRLGVPPKAPAVESDTEEVLKQLSTVDSLLNKKAE